MSDLDKIIDHLRANGRTTIIFICQKQTTKHSALKVMLPSLLVIMMMTQSSFHFFFSGRGRLLVYMAVNMSQTH